MNQKLIFFILGLLVGIISTQLINATNVLKFGSSVQDYKAQNYSDAIDSHFIEQMIPHHEDAITMAKLAQTNAKKTEVKELAKSIIDSQGNEINQMQDWYRDWFGKEVSKDSKVMRGHGMQQSNNMHMGMMGDESDLTSLEQAEDFDRAFVEEMIPHHQMAIMMASMLKVNTQRPEMIKLADDIIVAQTEEIELMRTWLREW